MDHIGCNWFRNIWSQFPEMVWMNFGNELPCEYISCSFEWADSLEVRVVGQLKRRISLESHRLKRSCGLELAKFRQSQAVSQVLGSLVKALSWRTPTFWYCSDCGCHTRCSLRWRHNERDSVSNHQPHDCLLNRLFRRRSNKTSKLRVTGLCVGNSPGTGEFSAQMASYAENVSIWWRHHD